MELVLASKSPRRREILRKLGMVFRLEHSDANEDKLLIDYRHQPIEERVKILSQSKAEDVAKKNPNKEWLILGADTVVVLDGQLFGKPQNRTQLLKMIKTMSGRTHQVLTAVSAVVPSLSKKETVLACTDVTFRSLTEQEINWYVNHADYLDKAGGYAIQEEGAVLVNSIHGCYYNVVGLPIAGMFTLFQSFGCSFMDFQRDSTIKAR